MKKKQLVNGPEAWLYGGHLGSIRGVRFGTIRASRVESIQTTLPTTHGEPVLWQYMCLGLVNGHSLYPSSFVLLKLRHLSNGVPFLCVCASLASVQK